MAISRTLMCLSLLLIVGGAAPAAVFPAAPPNRSACSSVGSLAACATMAPPRSIAPLATPPIIALWGGARHSLVLTADGTVWDWGLNHCGLATSSCGMLGDGTLLDRHVPNGSTDWGGSSRHTATRG